VWLSKPRAQNARNRVHQAHDRSVAVADCEKATTLSRREPRPTDGNKNLAR